MDAHVIAEKPAAKARARAVRARSGRFSGIKQAPRLGVALALSKQRGTAAQLSKAARKPVRLPIAIRALDVEDLTQPVETVLCPARHDRITVDSCRQCRDFRRIEPSATHDSVVCCGSRESACTASVQQKVQLPSVCATVNTTLAIVLQYADCLRPWEAIPVLDMQARPVGIVTSSELNHLRACRRDPTTPLKHVMSTSFATVFPCMSLVDAARLRAARCFRGVIVVSEGDRFVGVVWEPDLERGNTSTQSDSAQLR